MSRTDFAVSSRALWIFGGKDTGFAIRRAIPHGLDASRAVGGPDAGMHELSVRRTRSAHVGLSAPCVRVSVNFALRQRNTRARQRAWRPEGESPFDGVEMVVPRPVTLLPSCGLRGRRSGP